MGIMPLEVWNLLTQTPVLALIESFVLPAVIFGALGRLALRDSALIFAWLGALIGVLEFSVMAEVRPDGTPLTHASWIWGAHAAALMLTITSAIALIRHWARCGSGSEWRSASWCWSRWLQGASTWPISIPPLTYT